MVTVRAPATSANLGSGFDVFGVALDRPADVIRVEEADETTISVTGVGSRYVPTDPESNVAGVVASELDAPARIRIDKGVRTSSGLGSSAASAAGTALALNELYDLGYSRRGLVPVAAAGEAVVAGEAHADNVAPALVGGFTVVGGDVGEASEPGTADGSPDVLRVDADVPLVACLPDLAISTRDARAAVPDSAPMDAVVEVVARAATLTVGMHRSDPVLVGRGMADSVVTPARAALVEGYDDVRAAAIAAGATGATVSGAGPAVVAACRAGDRRAVASAMVAAFEAAGVDARAYRTGVGEGAAVCR